ncbi:MAG: IS21-like element helper ATPase IstB [Syntrophomonadaceae bacterium]|nr:IS21-like element helper ATPase IstB [Syntrophomonadaceae bacterium]
MSSALIQDYCKTLRLAYVPQIYEQIQADSQEAYLLQLLESEVEARKNTKVARLIKKAGFNQFKTFDDYDPSWALTLPETITLEELKDLVFLEKQQNLMMLGSVGNGKSHLSVALGIEACKRGKNVSFFRVADLVSKLLEKHQSGTLPRFIRELKKLDLLILDELGFIPFHKDGADLLFSVIAECYEQTSIIVTSNLEFGQWNTIFGDKRLTAAIIDRLVHHAHILSFTGESYRLHHALSKKFGTD